MSKTKSFWKRPSKTTPATSPKPAPRSKEEIQDEYNRACNQCGDFQYKIRAMSGAIEQLHRRMGELNNEMNQVVQAEIEAEQANAQQMPAAPPPSEAQN